MRNSFLLCLCLKINVRNFWFFRFCKFSYERFLSLELESSISQNIRSFIRVGCFYFSSSGKLESSVSQSLRKCSRCLLLAKISIVGFWQCSEYALGSKHVMVLNIPGFWINLSRNIRKFRFLKYKKVPFPEV